MARSGLILKLSCPDQAGIVAKIASYVAGHRGNLIEFAQFTDKLSLRFFARLEIETGELDVDPEDFIEGFGTLGRSMKADWHFRRLPYKMKTAVLVTKTDHCLNEILWRAEIGEMPVEITSIIGNRDTCRGIAERAGIPFHLVEMDGGKKEEGFSKIRGILAAESVELAVLARCIHCRSAPALKCRPSPASTMTRTLSSAITCAKTASISPIMASSKALKTAGRDMVICATPGARVVSDKVW